MMKIMSLHMPILAIRAVIFHKKNLIKKLRTCQIKSPFISLHREQPPATKRFSHNSESIYPIGGL